MPKRTTTVYYRTNEQHVYSCSTAQDSTVTIPRRIVADERCAKPACSESHVSANRARRQSCMLSFLIHGTHLEWRIVYGPCGQVNVLPAALSARDLNSSTLSHQSSSPIASRRRSSASTSPAILRSRTGVDGTSNASPASPIPIASRRRSSASTSPGVLISRTGS